MHIFCRSPLSLQSLSSQQTNIKLVSLEYTSTSHTLHVSSFLPPDPSSYYYYFFFTSHPQFGGGWQGRGLGLGLGRVQRRCSKAILICAHSHQRHSARLVSLQEHQSALSGTAVTNSNRYHFKTIGPARSVCLKPVAGAHLGHGWMGLPCVQHTGALAPGLTVGSWSDMQTFMDG